MTRAGTVPGTGTTHLEWHAVEPQKVTKTSELENDSGYTTQSEVDSLRIETNEAIEMVRSENESLINELNTMLGDKADKTQLPTKTSELVNDSGYTTQSYVDNAIGHVLTQEVF